MSTANEDASSDAVPFGMLATVQFALRRWGALGTLARYLLIKSKTRQFLISKTDPFDRQQKAALLKSFNLIQKKVPCAHSPYQFVLIAEAILQTDIPGPIVECGCYKGGRSAKLSLLAKMTNRTLIICDSFAGLPRPKSDDEAHLKGCGDHLDEMVMPGQYMGRLDEVRHNIETYGCLDVCQFVPGLFETSLPNLPVSPACVLIDVDLVSSARDGLKYLWPRTAPGGIWFTHEASFVNYVRGILDPEWWAANLNEVPPIIFSAGSGLSDAAKALAYFVKQVKPLGNGTWTMPDLGVGRERTG